MNTLIKNAKLILCSALIFGATGSKAQGVNPFELGVVYKPFTAQQIESLSANIDIVKSRLNEALQNAEGKTLDVANQIYVDAMKEVVLHSFQNTPRSGFLTRVALNQGLALTVGIPNADGVGVAKEGVLADTSNEDLITLILKNSIQLALSYYVEAKDQRTVKLTEIPYMKYALDQIKYTRDWLDSVTEPHAEYFAARAALVNFMAVVANDANLNINVYAKELVDIDAALKNKYPETLPAPEHVLEKVRELRKELRRLQAAVERVIGK